MIARHAQLARPLGERAGPPRAGARRARRRRTSGGTARASRASSRATTIPLASRIVQLAEFVEVAHRTGGIEAALDDRRAPVGQAVRPARWSRSFAPTPRRCSTTSTSSSSWDTVIDAEPALAVALSPAECDDGARGDRPLRRPEVARTRSATRKAVAELRRRRGVQLGVPADEVARAAPRRPGHGLRPSRRVQRDLGQARTAHRRRVGTGAAPPHLTERMLQQSHALAPLGRIAVQHRERLDGSGYPRGSTGAAISRAGRILAAADAYQAMREPRPHRDALSADDAATRAPRRGAGRSARRRRGRRRLTRRRPSRRSAARRSGRAHRPRGRGAAPRSRGDVEQGRSQRGSSSRPRPRATTSSTSTPRSVSRTGPPRASSQCSTACFRIRDAARLHLASQHGRIQRIGVGASPRSANASARHSRNTAGSAIAAGSSVTPTSSRSFVANAVRLTGHPSRGPNG